MPSICLAPPSVPSPATLLAQIRSSCSNAATSAGIKIDSDALGTLASSSSSSSLSSSAASSKDYTLSFPLRWDSDSHEINFLSLLSVLSILSPCEILLRQLPNNPHPSSLPRHLLLGLYLSAPPSNHASAPSSLSSVHLAGIGDGEIADVLGLKIHQEKRVEHIPVATLAERGGPGSIVVTKLRETINRVGDQCVQNRYVDLGAFVAETLGQCKSIAAGKGEEEAVGHFVHRLVSFLPIDMTDSYTLSEDVQVHLYTNALFLLLSLVLRFSSSTISSSPLPWLPSRSLFPLLADGQSPLLLVRRGILDLSQCTDRKLQLWGQWATSNSTSDHSSENDNREEVLQPYLTSDQAQTLRAATIFAGEQLRLRQRRVCGQEGEGDGESQGREQDRTCLIDFDAQVRREAGKEEEEGEGQGHQRRGLLIDEKEVERAGKW